MKRLAAGLNESVSVNHDFYRMRMRGESNEVCKGIHFQVLSYFLFIITRFMTRSVPSIS